MQIDFCSITEKDNPKDNNGLGQVSYEYKMSKYLITNEFYINAIKLFPDIQKHITDYAYYDRRFCIDQNLRCRDEDLKRPLTFVNPKFAKIFCNFLYNYDHGLPLDLESCYSLTNNKRLRKDGFFIPNMDEWYKAAYYNKKDYNLYPLAYNQEPLYVESRNDRIINSGEKTCNFTNAYDYLDYNGFTSRVGECGSYSQYEIYDMAGNVYEFIENEEFCIAGGSWHSFRETMQKDNFLLYDPKIYYGSTLGLRIIKI